MSNPEPVLRDRPGVSRDTDRYLNPNVVNLGVSATLQINEHSNALVRDGRTVYKFGLGQSPFPVPESVVRALRLYAPQKDYLPVKGLPALQEAVASFHSRKDLVDISPSNVIVGPGSKELLFLLQLVFNGEILIPGPGWVSYHPQARILGKQIHVLHTSFEEKWMVTPERLDAVAGRTPGPRLLILNYPGNPDGVTYSREQLQAIVAVARKRHVYVLSDEIYGQLHHQGKHISIARDYPEGTIISSGLSKWCGAGGWRLGTFSFPPDLKWLMDAMAAVASETYTSVSTPIQYAAVQAFTADAEMEEYLWHARRILALIGNKCVDMLQAAGVRVHPPEGAFYLFLDFSPLRDVLLKKGIAGPVDLCKRLLEDTGVAVLPGSAFNRPEDELTARMAYVDFDGSRALTASLNVPLHEPLPDDFLVHHCRKVIKGTEKLVDWLG